MINQSNKVVGWYWMDFQKKIIFSEKVRPVVAGLYIPANRHINDIAKKIGLEFTFKDYKQYCEDHFLYDDIYQFDGRSAKSVKYEPLQVDASTFVFMLSNFKFCNNFQDISNFIDKINDLSKKKSEKNDKRLIDIAKNQLKSVLDLIEKC